MKIVMLNGSPRKNGASATILEFVQAELERHDNVEVEYINISENNITYCNGCSVCFKTGECFIKDDAAEIVNKLSKADGVIIGSPTYQSNISGQLKTFFDRSNFVMKQRMRKKTAMIFTVGTNYGMKDSLAILDNLLVYSGAQVSFKAWYKMQFSNKYSLTPKMKKTIGRGVHAFVKTISSNRIIIKDFLINSAVFNIGIKPFALSEKSTYAGVVSHWQK